MCENLCDSLESHNYVRGYAALAANDASKMEKTEKSFFLNRILHEHLLRHYIALLPPYFLASAKRPG